MSSSRAKGLIGRRKSQLLRYTSLTTAMNKYRAIVFSICSALIVSVYIRNVAGAGKGLDGLHIELLREENYVMLGRRRGSPRRRAFVWLARSLMAFYLHSQRRYPK